MSRGGGAERPTFSKLKPIVMAGTDMVKYGRNGSPQLRFFRVEYSDVKVGGDRTVAMPFLTWAKNAKASVSGRLPLVELREVTRGATTPNFKRNSRHVVVGLRGEEVPPQQCFTLTFVDRPVDLYAPGAGDFDAWFAFMSLVVARNQELEEEGEREQRAQR